MISNKSIINSSLEVGLRSLIILNSIDPERIDIDRLVIYDYLVLHTEDVEKSYKSLHPSTPHRAGELLVRRQLLQEGINLMESKGLLDRHFLNNGIFYSANNLTGPFISYFETEYASLLHKYAVFIKEKFHHFNFIDLKNYVMNNLDEWGGEFENESILRGDID